MYVVYSIWIFFSLKLSKICQKYKNTIDISFFWVKKQHISQKLQVKSTWLPTSYPPPLPPLPPLHPKFCSDWKVTFSSSLEKYSFSITLCKQNKKLWKIKNTFLSSKKQICCYKIRKIHTYLTLANKLFSWKSLIAIFKFFNFNHLLLLHCSFLNWVPQHNKASGEKITRNNKESNRDKNYVLIEYWLNYALTNFLPYIFINLHIYFFKKRSTTFYFHITVKKLIEAILQNHCQNCLWTYYKQIIKHLQLVTTD